jgi:5-methylcytosine-specific restriction endonuclease McrA
MRRVKKGDFILHLLKGGGGHLVGYSYAADAVQEVSTPPPNPGQWGGRKSYYRIPVEQFTEIDPPLSIKGALTENHEQFKGILSSGASHLFFCQYVNRLQLTQGKYLTHVPPSLYSLLKGLTPNEMNDKPPASVSGQYREGAEQKYVQTRLERDTRAREAAIARYDRRCMVCDFSFDDFYGADYAVGYIEVHHTKPLSSMRGERVTSLEDLVVLCSNCDTQEKKRPVDWRELRAQVASHRKKRPYDCRISPSLCTAIRKTYRSP